MKNVFMAVIQRGGYDLTGMLKRIDEYHIGGKLTDADHDELVSAARGNARPVLQPVDEIQRLWAVINEMDKRIKTLEGGAAEDSGTATEYVPPTGAHNAYYHGAVVSYKGKVYRCIAPSGEACSWPPDVMPSYWEEA